MSSITLGKRYEGANNNFKERQTDEIWDLLERLVDFPPVTKLEHYHDRRAIMSEIAEKMGISKC